MKASGRRILALLFPLPLAASAAVFTTDAVITPLNLTYDGQNIVVSNATLTVDGPHTFANLLIAPGGVVTHTFSTSGKITTNQMVLDEPQVLSGTNEVTLASANVVAPSVSLNDPSGTITYTNTTDYEVRVSGGQVFLRRSDTSTIPDGAMVLVSYEVTAGSIAAGLSLTLTGNLEVATGGAINVTGCGFGGNVGTGNGGETGSTLTGAGAGHGGFGGNSSSNAIGGTCYGVFDQPTTLGSGGGLGVGGVGGSGGGAIKLVIAGSATINGLITATGADATNNRSGGGSGGSIWITAQTVSGTGTITAHGGAGEPIHGGGGGGGRIALQYGVNDFTGTSAAYGGNGSKIGGAGTVFTKLTAQNGLLLVDNGGRAGTNSLIALTNGVDILIRSNAAVLPAGNWLARDVTIQADAAISADATGSPSGSGMGPGNFSLTETSTRPCSGGGHGGYGAMASTNVPGGNAYGVLESPTTVGSGGGHSSPVSIGGGGGGAIRMTVSGTLWVEGRLSANGGNGSGSGGGGGAGGSVYLTAGTMAGDGLISANGGAGAGSRGGGGGGGRIAIFPGTNLFTGTIGAFGGGVANWAGAGTVFIQTNQAGGQLILDNNGHLGTNTPVAPVPFTDLTIRDGAIGQLITSLSLQNLLVASNGWLTVRTQSTPMTLNLTISGNATIHPGGGILLDARGSGQNSGQGGGRFNNNIARLPGSGGGHGGYGANSVGGYATGGNSYNSSSSPTAAGSGGGGGSTSSVNASFGGVGGGALRLFVFGTLNLGGKISANGGNGAGLGGGGGSGGSIWLTLGALAGSGSITANGGHGVDSIGGGGGGGRIAITVTSNTFTGNITAYGGGGANWGGAGTVLIGSNEQNIGLLLLDNGGNAGTNTTFQLQLGFVDLTVANGAIGQIGPGSLTVRNLLVRSNAVLSPVAFGTMQTVNATGNVVVEAGGAISADGKGISNLGFGFGDGTPRGGGGHGGWGGANRSGRGAVYGSVTTPSFPGSQGGGAGGFQGPVGGAGGGALRLIVTGTLTVNGRISANGTDGDLNCGGGSGGSLWITTSGALGPFPVFTGNGVISANGGVGIGQAGGGGGGRISITYGSNSFTGTYSATGGPGLVGGGAGTIYTKAVNAPVGELLVDNGGLSGTNTPLATTNGLPTVPFNLAISRRASVLPLTPLPLLSNLHLTAGAILTMRTNETNLVVNVLHDMDISDGSAIAVDGKGFSRTNGAGAGRTLSNQGGGGGYGGDGGASASGAAGGTNYGSLTQPVHRGSGGGTGSGPLTGGSEGGGAIRLNVGGTLTVNGRVGANGNSGLQDDSGGGSGGSLWLTAGALMGAGLINADGAAGEWFNGGGGGGGRIAIYSPMNTFTGLVSAAGGAGWTAAGTGTVFQSTSLGAFAVISNSPSGVVSNGVNGMDFVSTSQINLFTVSDSNVTLQVPPGTLAVTNLTFSNVSPTTLRVSFPFQTTPGDYYLRLGPGIEDIFGQPLSQVYTGAFTIVLPTIQGVVTNANGQPVPGVAVRVSGLESGAVTDANGTYQVGYVPPGYLTLVPTLPGHAIVPASRTYWELTNSLVNQDFLMVDTVARAVSAISSGTNLVLNWPGLPGVRYQAETSTDLVNWWSFGLALDGTNGLMELLVPMDDAPKKFLRVWATY